MPTLNEYREIARAVLAEMLLLLRCPRKWPRSEALQEISRKSSSLMGSNAHALRPFKLRTPAQGRDRVIAFAGKIVRLRADIGGDDRRIVQHIGGRAGPECAPVIEDVKEIGEIGHHLHIVLDPDHGEAELVFNAHERARAAAVQATDSGTRP